MFQYMQWIDTVKYEHHRKSIKNIHDHLSKDKDILAVLLGGSVAHGYARSGSDVDIMIILTPDAYEIKNEQKQLYYYANDLTPYEGGYVDGKYLSISYMRMVADRGSEPSRFAFKHSLIIFSKDDEVEQLMTQAIRYPKENKEENIFRFHAQLNAWKWYTDEALKRNDRYLLMHSVSSMILFACRIVLAHNERLYPYHKAMLIEVKKCLDKPKDMLKRIDTLLDNMTAENISALYECVRTFHAPEDGSWPPQFIVDSELNWLQGNCPIADI